MCVRMEKDITRDAGPVPSIDLKELPGLKDLLFCQNCVSNADIKENFNGIPRIESKKNGRIHRDIVNESNENENIKRHE